MCKTTFNIITPTQKYLLLILLFGVIIPFVYGQPREELEQEKQRIEEEINLTTQMLKETKKSAETNLNQLIILNNQIKQREELINNINNRVSIINNQINELEGEIEILDSELKELKDSYANMIYHAYKNRSEYQRLMFLFSAKDFNQAYMRMKYMQKYARHRELQAEKIEETTNELNLQLSILEQNKKEQQNLLANYRNEINNLTHEKEEQSKTLNTLRNKEETLASQLKQQEKEAEELSKEIQRIIEEEKRRAAEKAKAEGRATPAKAFELTPEEQIISNNFYENKGALPWPSERGVITQHFGKQPHPVLSGVSISSDGVNISTTEGAKARAVFKGTVVRVFSIPGGNNAIIIRHGEYLTVYSNISEVFVSNGQKINTQQEIGIISTDPRDRKTELHMQVWKGTDKLNPEHWIAKR